MFRPDRGTLRAAGFVVLLIGVFLLVNTQVVYAASSNGETGDLLAPLNITSSEGVPINSYELDAEGGSIVAFKSQALAFALSGLFTLIRLLVGLAGWAVEMAFRFPLLKILTRPAQHVADAYNHVVVDTLGLKGLLLAWAFVFAGFMIVRGRVGRGLGEIFLTLLIGAFAASAFVRPDFLLAKDGPIAQGQEVAASVAQQSVNSYDWGGKIAGKGPCAGLAGNPELKCLQQEDEAPVTAEDVARPLQDSITNALVVKPYMLLEYGRILDPSKPSDRKAYAVHLKWITGGYRAGSDTGNGDCGSLASPMRDTCEKRQKAEYTCSLVKGEAKQYCLASQGIPRKTTLPSLTADGDLLGSSNAIVTDEDQQFAAFLDDMKKAGPVGKACAEYAGKPTWWRVCGAALLLVAALFICGMLLSSAVVLLGTQAVCAGAAAAGGVTFVAGMLPGPARQSVWKWLSLWGVAVLAVVGICAFIPFFGIAVDATITNGPDLMVERILLIDVLAIAGAAGHRRLLASITSFGRRMTMRMRYAKVGGTHLPGDTELGAALAMNSPAGLAGYGAGLRSFTGGGGGRFGVLGTRQRLMGALSSLLDGAGMPVDPGQILADASAEAGRGLAPLTAGAAVGGLGARLGGKAASWLLIGRRPDAEQLAKWRKLTLGEDPSTGDLAGAGSGGTGPQRPSGPADRYRNAQGQIVDRNTGEVLHDQNSDRALLSTRAHNRLVRFRGYRILHRGGRIAYGATAGLPANVRRARSGGSRSSFSQDARQQVRVWANTVREDGRAWSDTGRHVARVLRDNSDSSGVAPFAGRRLGATSGAAPAGRPAPGPARPAGGGATTTPRPSASHRNGPAPRGRPDRDGPVLPGGGRARSRAREAARARMQELLRRTAADAERRSREGAERPNGDGEDE
ncbi:hypothetical protein [Streptomyces sp. CAS3]